MRRDTACNCDLSPYIFVTAWRFRTSDFAMTFTASCIHQMASSGCATLLNPSICLPQMKADTSRAGWCLMTAL